MVPERCLTLASERLLVRRPEGILVNPVERSEMGPRSIPRRLQHGQNRVGLCQHQRRGRQH
jgi:hypothetical protein